MAVQAGVLPIDPEDVEGAIALNGVAVEVNTQAFRWGRVQIIDPDTVELQRQLAHAPHVVVEEQFSGRLDDLGVSGEHRATLSSFASELEAWGSSSTTAEWFDMLDRVAASERAVSSSDELLMSVAAGMFKLVAYKDEYEVARLMTLDAGLEAAREVAGETGAIAWKLHPPMLRALGIDRKITIGKWATPGIKVLARGKRLRGTALDPFGRAKVRRVEQELPADYLAAIDLVLERLTADNLPEAISLAELPDVVRGYEDIKLANVESYRLSLAEGLRKFQ